MGEAQAKYMENVAVGILKSGTAVKYGDVSPRPLQFPTGGNSDSGPHPHSISGTAGAPGHEHSHSLPTQVVPDPNNPGQMIAVPEGHQWSPSDINKMIHNAVADAVAHLVGEIDGLTQRCQELEIELHES